MLLNRSSLKAKGKHMASNSQRIKRFVKGLSISVVAVFYLAGFAFIEVMMSGSNLDNPSEALWWLGLNVVNVVLAVGLIKLIMRL